MEWLAGVFSAWREMRGKREKGRIPIASNLHLGRRKQASIKSLPKVLSEVPFWPPMPGSYLSSQDTLSFGVWKRQPPNPAKGQCWDGDGNRSPGFWPGLATHSWAFLSLSLASVSHLLPSPQEFCEGQYIAQC